MVRNKSCIEKILLSAFQFRVSLRALAINSAARLRAVCFPLAFIFRTFTRHSSILWFDVTETTSRIMRHYGFLKQLVSFQLLISCFYERFFAMFTNSSWWSLKIHHAHVPTYKLHFFCCLKYAVVQIQTYFIASSVLHILPIVAFFFLLYQALVWESILIATKISLKISNFPAPLNMKKTFFKFCPYVYAPR
jgi:hypothetical protein